MSKKTVNNSITPARRSVFRHSRQVKEYNYMNIREIKQNPVRDYRSVEKGNITTPRIPLGMQPVFRNEVAFLRNADTTGGYNFLPSDIPYGNGLKLYSLNK